MFQSKLWVTLFHLNRNDGMFNKRYINYKLEKGVERHALRLIANMWKEYYLLQPINSINV